MTGSKIDMAYFKDIQPWTLYGEKLTVADSNEHLGLIVSGLDEEQKNTDNNILKCRNALFSMLGPTYSYKCLLSPLVQTYVWRTCHLPILLSGLPALPIRPAQLDPLSVFHRKILRGFLKLSNSSPIPALYFLLGELPIEATLHIRTLGLLYNIADNQASTANSIVKYILMMCRDNSTTWSNHVRSLCLKYDLPSPLTLLQGQGPLQSKESWITLVKTKVTIWHEEQLRTNSKLNTKMRYLNVDLLGLSGRAHPSLINIKNTQDVKKLRLHLKFLCGDYLTNQNGHCYPRSINSCSLCHSSEDTYEHLLIQCRGTSEVRERILPTLYNVVSDVQPTCGLLQYNPPPTILLQFILDCTSLNLPNDIRIPAHNPRVSEIFHVSRDLCFGISSARCRLLRES